MKYIIFFLVQIFLLLSTTAYTQSQYRFQHYGRKDGLANDFAGAVVQDSLGYIWVQYYDGLSRFDGYNFKIYKYDPKDALRSALNFTLGQLVADPAGNIWITDWHEEKRATGRYTLVKHDRSSDGFIKYEIDLKGPSNVGAKVFEKDGSLIWICIDNGLVSFNHLLV